jgi:maleate isomerase
MTALESSPQASRYTPSAERRKIGHITPSSNTVLEPMTIAMSHATAAISHHFARIKVEAITLTPQHTSQFSLDAMLAAAELLADAGVDAIVWNGTSGGWNGIASDHALCAQITHRTGVPATTTMLAQLELLERAGLNRIGLALPYTDDVCARISQEFGAAGLEVVACANARVSNNQAMALLDEHTIRSLVRQAAVEAAECVLVFCTGVAGAHLVQELELELGRPVFDSVAVSLWKTLTMVGIEPRLPGWGWLFQPPLLAHGA